MSRSDALAEGGPAARGAGGGLATDLPRTKTADLEYDLPAAAIAQHPAPRRDEARLLVCDVGPRGLSIEHAIVRDLPKLLPPRSLVVQNDTRVIPARLLGKKRGTGGAAELFLVEPMNPERTTWRCLGRSSKGLREGTVVELDRGITARVVRAEPLEILFEGDDVAGSLRAIGRTPLPPYVQRDEEPADRERYQTVFAERDGSIAAPTAGLHFTPELLARIAETGHGIARLTLHVGLGTFLPVKTEELADHPMHVERFEVTEAAARAVVDAKADGRPVVAVGTTVVRTLETLAERGGVRAGIGETRLLIAPGYPFRVVDHLFTNFHMPRSTLLALVWAFASKDAMRDAYARALAEGYRFGSYGDAMLIRRSW